jgi:hypothetical protein
VRKALETLPWVEQETIQMDFDTREVKFGIKDKSQFNAEAILKALKGQGFPNSTVKTPPS